MTSEEVLKIIYQQSGCNPVAIGNGLDKSEFYKKFPETEWDNLSVILENLKNQGYITGEKLSYHGAFVISPVKLTSTGYTYCSTLI